MYAEIINEIRKNIEKGQTLIEVLAALSIVVVLLFGITSAVNFSLSNVQFTKNQNLANQYAGQGIGVVKQIWNSDLSFFNGLPSEGGNYYCLDKDKTTLTSEDKKDANIQGCSKAGNSQGNNVYNFARQVELYKNSGDCSLTGTSFPTPEATKVIVTVSWSDGKCTDHLNLYCHKVQLVSCLSKTQTLQTP